MIWFPFYTSDFLGATIGLSHAERGTYALMLVTYFELEKPLPLDRPRCYRTVGCESDEQKRAVDMILQEFFVERDDGWYQPRAEDEIARWRVIQAQQAEKGRKSGAARREKATTVKPQLNSGSTVDEPPTPTPTPRTTTTSKDSGRFAPSVGFQKFWSEYPRKMAKAKAAAIWTKLAPEEQAAALAAIPAHVASEQWQRDEGRYIPHPTTWLNQRRWEDQLPEPDTDEAMAERVWARIETNEGRAS